MEMGAHQLAKWKQDTIAIIPTFLINQSAAAMTQSIVKLPTRALIRLAMRLAQTQQMQQTQTTR